MKVFISSTYLDLKEHRSAVIEAVGRMRLQYSSMEIFGSQPNSSLDVSKKEIDTCDYLIGIYAWRYGHFIENESKSITEIEFDYAKSKSIKCLVYLVDKEYPWPETYRDTGETLQRLMKFKNRVGNLVRSTFTTPDNLAKQVVADLFREYSRSDCDSDLIKNEIESKGNVTTHQPIVISDTAYIELTLDRDFKTFNECDEEQLLRAISELLKIGDIKIRSRREGSVILTLQVNSADVEHLLKRINSGALNEFMVLKADLISYGNADSVDLDSFSFILTNRTLLVFGRGHLTFRNAAKLKSILPRAVGDDRIDAIIFDLSECIGLDSTILGVLAGVALELRRKGKRKKLLLSNSSLQTVEFIRSLGLHRLAILVDLDKSLYPVLQRFIDGGMSRNFEEVIVEAHELLPSLDWENEKNLSELLKLLKGE